MYHIQDEKSNKPFVFESRKAKKTDYIEKEDIIERLRKYELAQHQSITAAQNAVNSKLIVLGISNDINFADEDESTELLENVKDLFSAYGTISSLRVQEIDGNSFVEIIYLEAEAADIAAHTMDKMIIRGIPIRVLSLKGLEEMVRIQNLIVEDDVTTIKTSNIHSADTMHIDEGIERPTEPLDREVSKNNEQSLVVEEKSAFVTIYHMIDYHDDLATILTTSTITTATVTAGDTAVSSASASASHCNNIIDHHHNNDDEELQEVLQDCYTLCSSSSATTAAQLKQIWIDIRSSSQVNHVDDNHILSSISSQSSSPMVVIDCTSHLLSALFLAQSLHSLIIGGEMLTTTLHLFDNNSKKMMIIDCFHHSGCYALHLPAFLTLTQWQCQEEREEILQDISYLLTMEECSEYYTNIIFVQDNDEADQEQDLEQASLSVYILYDHLYQAYSGYEHLQGKMISGERLTVQLAYIKEEEDDDETAMRGEDEDNKVEKEGDYYHPFAWYLQLVTIFSSTMMNNTEQQAVYVAIEGYINAEDLSDESQQQQHEDIVIYKQDLLQIMQEQITQSILPKKQQTAAVSLSNDSEAVHDAGPLKKTNSNTNNNPSKHMSSLQALLAKVLTKVSSSIHGVHIINNDANKTALFDDEQQKTEDEQQDKRIAIVIAEYNHPSAALSSMLQLDGMLLGGRQILAKLLSSPPPSTVSSSSFSHTSVVSDGDDQRKMIIGPWKPNSSSHLDHQSISDQQLTSSKSAPGDVIQSKTEEFAVLSSSALLTQLMNSIKGKEEGEENSVSASAVLLFSHTFDSTLSNKIAKTANETIAAAEGYENKLTTTHQPRKISLYITAKLAPKLGYYSLTSSHHHNLQVDDKSRLPIATEEINLYIKELLHLLSTFQKRLKEKKDLEAKKGKLLLGYKQKQRYVTGMREVYKAMKVGKVKLLILAPNTEQSEALDDKIEEIIKIGKDQEIPMIYGLSKRLLGKALQLSMKQSLVAIFQPDGAYELFRKIVAFIKPPPETSAVSRPSSSTSKVMATKTVQPVKKVMTTVAAKAPLTASLSLGSSVKGSVGGGDGSKMTAKSNSSIVTGSKK